MGPISSYKELIQRLTWDNARRENERWYIFLLMNPRNQTNAGIDIIKNFSYLNARTGNVTFFLPGFSNLDEGVVPYRSSHGYEIVYHDESFGELYFDEGGFLDTVTWLERNCPRYRYSEGLDLVIVKYRPVYIDRCNYAFPGGLYPQYERNFDFQNMTTYNLDSLKQDGINTIRMITECMRTVSKYHSEREVRQRLEDFVLSNTGYSYRHMHQTISVFVAGAKVLKRERDAVISALTHITNTSLKDYAFRVMTYEDFDRSLTEGGRQQEYNDYIANDAEYAIFILDNVVGGITFEEFNVAMQSFKSKGKPEIYVYSCMSGDPTGMLRGFFRRRQQSEGVIAIRRYLSEIGQYYIEYRDVDDLKNHIAQDFRRYSL